MELGVQILLYAAEHDQFPFAQHQGVEDDLLWRGQGLVLELAPGHVALERGADVQDVHAHRAVAGDTGMLGLGGGLALVGRAAGYEKGGQRYITRFRVEIEKIYTNVILFQVFMSGYL